MRQLNVIFISPSKRRQKKQATKYNKQPEAYITNEQYEEPLAQKKARIVPSRRTYLETTKFAKKICVIGDSHLNRIERNIFQKSVNKGKRYFDVYRGAASKRLYPTTLHQDQPDVVLLIGSNDINNQMKDKINTEKLARDIINIGKSCINLGVKEVVISSILCKKNIVLTCLMRQVSNSLREQYVLYGFGFIFNLEICLMFQEHIYGKMRYI